MTRLAFIALVLVGCGQAEAPSPAAEPGSSPSQPSTSPQPATSPEPVSPESVSPEPTEAPPGEEPDDRAAEAPPTPAVAPDPAPAAAGQAASLAAALSPADPEAFSLVATRAHRADEVVLYRLRGALLWRAAQEAAGTLPASEARNEAAIERCEEGEQTFDHFEVCIVEHVQDAFVAWDHLFRDGAWTWAVARVRRRGERVEVGASRLLFGPALRALGADTESEIRVRDLDHDGEPEITVMFPVMVPDADMYDEVTGAMGYVLAWEDLHTQFRTSRVYLHSSGDADTESEEVLTAWRVGELNDDGHPDLRVTERSRRQWDDIEADDHGETSDTDRADCLWQAATDVYACDVQLGTGLFEHGARP